MAVEYNTLRQYPTEFNAELPLEPEASPLDLRSEFGKGLRSGFSSLGATTDAALATFLSDPGDPSYVANMAEANRQQQDAAAAAPRIQKLQEIKGLRDAFDWFAGTAGSALASSAPSLAAGVATLPFGGLGAAATGFSGRALAGRVAAGAGASFLPEAGETVLSAPAGSNIDEVRKAAAAKGVANAALESIVPALLPGQVAKAFTRDGKAGVRAALGVGIKDTAAESLTETAQEYTGELAKEFLKTGSFKLADPDWDDLINAAAAGAVGGGVLGSVPAAANLLGGAAQRVPVERGVDLARTGVERARGLFGRQDRTPEDLVDEGEFLGGRDTVAPEVVARGPGAIFDDLSAADQRRADLAAERRTELLARSDLSPELREELDGFEDRLDQAGVQRRIAEEYYPKKVEDTIRDLKTRAFSSIKALFSRGDRKANLQGLPQNVLDSVKSAFDRYAPGLDEEGQTGVLTLLAQQLGRGRLEVPTSIAGVKDAPKLLTQLAHVMSSFGLVPRGTTAVEVKQAFERAQDRGRRMSNALDMAVRRSLSPEMRDAISPEDAASFLADYITFGTQDKAGTELLLDAMFGDRRASIMKLARNLGFKPEVEPETATIGDTTRYAVLAEEQPEGAPPLEGLTETDKGFIYGDNGKPFQRGSKEFNDTIQGLRATKTPYRVRTFRDVLERSGLESAEVDAALRRAGTDPVVIDTTLEDEALSDDELDAIIWDPAKGDKAGDSVFMVANENGEEVPISAIALVNTVGRREGSQGRSNPNTVGALFAEGLTLLATSPRVQDVPSKFHDGLLIQRQPKKFTWGDIKQRATQLSEADQKAAGEIGVSAVHDARREGQQAADRYIEKALEDLDNTNDVEQADERIAKLEKMLVDKRPAKDAATSDKVAYRAFAATVHRGIADIERLSERIRKEGKGREQTKGLVEPPGNTLREQDKPGKREFQEETGAPLTPANPRLTSMQRAVAKALLGKRTAFQRAKKGPFKFPPLDQKMLEMALDERTPIQIQRLMFAAFSPKTQKMADLSGKTFKYADGKYTLVEAKSGDKAATKSIEDAYQSYKKIADKRPWPFYDKEDKGRKLNQMKSSYQLTDEVRTRLDDIVINDKYNELDQVRKVLSFYRAAVARWKELRAKNIDDLTDQEEVVYYGLKEAVLPVNKRGQYTQADVDIFLTEAGDWDSLSKEDQALARAKLKEITSHLNMQDPGHYDLTAEDQKDIRAYIDKVLGPQVRVVFEKAGVDLGSYGQDEIRLLLRTRNQKDVHYHEALHALFERMSGRDKKALVDAAQSAPILNRIRELIGNDPRALEQLKDPEERVAYMFQFWASGELKIGPRTEGIFQKIVKAIRGFFGVLSQNERAELVMQYFHQGRFRDKWFETERSFTEKQLDRFENFTQSADGMLSAVAATAQSRMRDSEIPALIDIANAMRPENGEGFIARKFRVTNKYISKLNNILRGVDQDTLDEAVKVLRFEKPLKDASPAVTKVVNDTRALLEEMDQYLRVQKVKRLEWNAADKRWEEVDPGYIKNYFPRVWDTQKLLKEKDQFITMLRSKYPHNVKSREAAEDIYNSLIQSSGEGDLSDPNTAYSPFKRAVNVRNLTFFKDGEDIAPWLEKDYVNIMSTYLAQAVRRGEYTARFGTQGQWLREKVVEAGQQGATKEQINTAINYIRAVDGTLGYDRLSPEWQRLMGGMTVYQNVRLLPFAIFSSLIDPLGVGLRSNSIGAAWNAFKRGISGIPNVAREEDERDVMYKLAERIGTIESRGMMEALGQMYSSMHLRGWPKALNDKLFKYNLMDGWNRQMRIAATETSLDFIEKHLGHPEKHSARYLTELGLKPEDAKVFIKPDGGLKLFVEDGLTGPQADQINAAVMKFVDGSVLRPDATQRPIWASDPRYMFLFHLKQFSYSFYETIVKRALSEAQAGNLYPMYVLGSYVPFMMAADFAKDMLLNGGEPPEWKKNWSLADHTWYGVERAGLLGPSQFLVDAAEFGPQSILGPSLEQVVSTLQNPQTGLRKSIPGYQVWS